MSAPSAPASALRSRAATAYTRLVTMTRAAGIHGVGLAIIRILTGYLWYTQLSWKQPWTTPGYNELHKYVVTESHHATIPLYRALVANVLLPNYTLVAYLTYAVEAALAISLIFGLLTRLGGLVGALWAAQLYIGLSAAPGEWYWTYGMLVLINAVAWVSASGRWFGADHWLRPRLARLATRTTASPTSQRLAHWLTLAS